ncbi:MAG: hypothetical protein ACRD59_10520 [Candidatus Acidiferrales bacterium]
MNYQSGSATSSTDLLQQLVTWLVGLGWTQDRSAAEGSGWTASLHKNGNYAHLRAAESETTIWSSNFGAAHYGLHMFTGTAFIGGQLFKDQTTGAPIASGGSNTIGVGMQLSAGPFSNYFFFADGTADNIVVVVEKTPGLYEHIGWGLSLEKAGSYTGGAYFFGSAAGYYVSDTSVAAGTNGFTSSSDCPGVNLDAIGGGCMFVRADVDSWTGKWVSISVVASGNQGYTGKIGDCSVKGKNNSMKSNFPVYAYSNAGQFQERQTSQQDGRANLLPLMLWAQRDSTTSGFSLLGTVPWVFASNAVGNGFSNADEYVIGSTTYKLFPNFAVVKQ